ncbi:MAG: NAD-dependent epimerase/dehydratase family protein [Verrucomicrobiota bacterium]
MQKTLVTGANGFIGKHLMDRLGESASALTREDVSLADEKSMIRLLSKVEMVIHLAWSSTPGVSDGWREDIANARALFDACEEAAVKRIVFLSSGGSIYGVPREVPIRESHPLNPVCDYGRAKQEAEVDISARSAVDWVILRGANAFGPGQLGDKGQGVIGAWMRRVRNGEPIQLFGDGSIIRDFLYVSDLVDALCLATEIHSGRLTLNIGSGRGYSMLEVLSAIQSVTGIFPKIERLPERDCDVPTNVLDCLRAKEELGWTASTNLKDGIEQSWKWWSQVASNS